MKYLPWILCGFMLLSQMALAIEQDRAARLNELMGLSLEELGEVEVKLDEVFDVFDGLVKQQKVKVASGRAQSSAIAPSVTSLITAQDIEVSGARTLAEVLRMVPGLHISTMSNWQPIYVLRGIVNFTNPEVLFLLNGMPIKNPSYGNRGMFEIVPDVQSIARIEVIRGPGSAVYGADAFSGVINIITKSALEIDGTEAGLRVGSYDTYEAWVLHGSRQGEVDIATSIQLRRSDGLDAIIEQDMQSLIDTQMASAMPGYQPVSNAPGPLHLPEKKLNAHLSLDWRQWRLNLDYTNLKDWGTGLYVLNLDQHGSVGSHRYSADLIWHEPHLKQKWEVQARWSYQRWMNANQLWYNPPGTILLEGLYPDGVIEDSKYHEDVLRFDTDWFYHGLSLHVPRFGFGVFRETAMLDYFRRNQGLDANGNLIPAGSPLVDLTNTPYASITQRNLSRNNWYLFVQDSWAFAPGWEFTAGIRYDDYSDFGSTANPRAALVWQTTPHFTSKLLYGRAFRAPTLQEMYLNSALLRGNRNLHPETINAYELAFNWHISEVSSQTLSLYYFEIKDKILPVESIDYAQFLNSGEREGAGAELEIRWKITTQASLLFNYAYADNIAKPQHNVTGKYQEEYREMNYPRHTAYLRLDWMFYPNWYVDSQAYWAADYARPPDYQYPQLDDNFSVDLTLRYKKAHDWDWNLAIGLRNLFDHDLREPAITNIIANDFPLGGRTWFAEVRYLF